MLPPTHPVGGRLLFAAGATAPEFPQPTRKPRSFRSFPTGSERNATHKGKVGSVCCREGFVTSERSAFDLHFFCPLVYRPSLKNLCFHFRNWRGTGVGARIPNGVRGTGVASWLDGWQGVENERACGTAGSHQPCNRVEIWQPLEVQGVKFRLRVGV